MCAVTKMRLLGMEKMNLRDGMKRLVPVRKDIMYYQRDGLQISKFAEKALCEWEPIYESPIYLL